MHKSEDAADTRSEVVTLRGDGNRNHMTSPHVDAQLSCLGRMEENKGDKSNITTQRSYFSSHHSFSFRTCNKRQWHRSTREILDVSHVILTHNIHCFNTGFNMCNSQTQHPLVGFFGFFQQFNSNFECMFYKPNIHVCIYIQIQHRRIAKHEI